jgi:tungstate transport system substrate-binding protein
MRVCTTIALTCWLAAAGCQRQVAQPIDVGVPTTLQDSGLIDVLIPAFTREHPAWRIRFVAGGSGELLSLGRRGDLDVLLAHAPVAELQFMEAGHGLERRVLMENDFVIVGPGSDPARIRGMSDAAAALVRIATSDALFLSRGDDSGTHQKELQLRGADPNPGVGYREMGQGMGAVLRATSDQGGYTLADRATFTVLASTLELEVLVEGDPRLRNVYSVIVVADARAAEGALAFANWLTSPEGASVIADYGVDRFGRSLFQPVTRQPTE